MNTWMIKSNAAGEKVELTGLDLNAGFCHFDIAHVFSQELDTDRFREAVNRTVGRYPMLGGKLVKENGRLFIDPDGPGVVFSVEESGEAPPKFGPGYFPIDKQDVFHASAPPSLGRVMNAPLTQIKMTRFVDGTCVMGMSFRHFLMDAYSESRLIEDIRRNYFQEPAVSDTAHSRAGIVARGKRGATAPSQSSGAQLLPGQVFDPATAFIQPHPFSVYLTAEHRVQCAEIAQALKSENVSFNDVLHALIFRAFVNADTRSTECVHANMAVDTRWMEGLGVPRNHFGIGVLHRTLSMPRSDALAGNVKDLARRFRDFGVGDPESAAQDIGFYQQQYESGRYNDMGFYTNVLPSLANGGLFINNCSLIPTLMNEFGGLGRWMETALIEPLNIRFAFAMSDCQGGIPIRMVLSQDEAERFPVSWRDVLGDFLQ